MDWNAILIAVATAVGSSGMFAAMINANVSKKLGKEANEIEATKTANANWAAFLEEQRESFDSERKMYQEERERLQSIITKIEDKLETTQNRVSKLERRQVLATRYIEKLKDHIWQRLDPPPPDPDPRYDLN